MNPKDIVRTGYDKISHTYRGDAIDRDDPDIVAYVQWVTELITIVPGGGSVLELGCGNGVPVAQLLAQAGFAVTGVRRGYYTNPVEDALIFWRENLRNPDN